MSHLPCFKAYDLRGRVPEELDHRLAYRIGRAYAEYLGRRRVAVGQDMRLSSEGLVDARLHHRCVDDAEGGELGQVAQEVGPSREDQRGRVEQLGQNAQDHSHKNEAKDGGGDGRSPYPA